MQRAFLITAVAALLIAPNAVQAKEARDTVRIETSDIDTSSAQGAAQMLRRLRHAADDVCDVRGGVRPLTEQAQATQCVRDTMQQAVAALSDPMVTAAYDAQSPTIVAVVR